MKHIALFILSVFTVIALGLMWEIGQEQNPSDYQSYSKEMKNLLEGLE